MKVITIGGLTGGGGGRIPVEPDLKGVITFSFFSGVPRAFPPFPGLFCKSVLFILENS